MLNKANLRQTLIAKRLAIPPDSRALWNHILASKLLTWLAEHPVKTLGVYWPMRGEPDLHDAYISLAEQGIQLALPVVLKKASPLAFACWSPGDAVEVDQYGVSVPAHPRFISPSALLIPCVGFNTGRFRLGYGGGFYDRTLAQQPRPLAIGVAYSCAQAEFKIGEHDVALDAIITEQGIL